MRFKLERHPIRIVERSRTLELWERWQMAIVGK
jgi:hypothetical protein